MVIRQTEEMHEKLGTFFKQLNEARNEAPQIVSGGGFFKIPEEDQPSKHASTKEGEQPQTQQAEEMVVRFYPGLPKQTAESLRRALGTLIPADWSWSKEKGAVVVTLEDSGEVSSTTATLVVRQTPDVQKRVAALVQEVDQWTNAAARRQSFQFPGDILPEDLADATLPEQWEGPDGRIWQLFWVPTNSVHRLHLTLAFLLPEIKSGVVVDLRMLGLERHSETIMMLHVPKKSRLAVAKFFTEWEKARNYSADDSKEAKCEPAQHPDGFSFVVPKAYETANVVANVVEANQPTAEANYETRYYNFHGRTAESMQKLLPQVLPEIWPAGGKASVSFVPGMGDPGATIGTLMVRQTPAGHEKVEAYFRTLRTVSQELQKQIDDKENYPCYSQPADDSGYAVKYHYLPTPMANHLAELLPKYFASDWQQGTVRTLSGPASKNLQHFSYSILIVRQQSAVHEQIDKVIHNVRHWDGQEAEVAVPVPASLRELEATVGGGSFF